MTTHQVSVDKQQILEDGWHVLGLFLGDSDDLFHLEVHNSRDKEGETEGGRYENLTGRSIAHFLASRTSGLLANGETTIVLEFDQQGRFLRAF